MLPKGLANLVPFLELGCFLFWILTGSVRAQVSYQRPLVGLEGEKAGQWEEELKPGQTLEMTLWVVNPGPEASLELRLVPSSMANELTFAVRVSLEEKGESGDTFYEALWSQLPERLALGSFMSGQRKDYRLRFQLTSAQAKYAHQRLPFKIEVFASIPSEIVLTPTPTLTPPPLLTELPRTGSYHSSCGKMESKYQDAISALVGQK